MIVSTEIHHLYAYKMDESDINSYLESKGFNLDLPIRVYDIGETTLYIQVNNKEET